MGVRSGSGGNLFGSGEVSLSSAQASGEAGSGSVRMESGVGPAGKSGDMTIKAGEQLSSAPMVSIHVTGGQSAGLASQVLIAAGASASAAGGALATTSGTGALGSGSVDVRTTSVGSEKASGSLQVSSGVAVSDQSPGSLLISVGSAGGPGRGDISFVGGSSIEAASEISILSEKKMKVISGTGISSGVVTMKSASSAQTGSSGTLIMSSSSSNADSGSLSMSSGMGATVGSIDLQASTSKLLPGDIIATAGEGAGQGGNALLGTKSDGPSTGSVQIQTEGQSSASSGSIYIGSGFAGVTGEISMTSEATAVGASNGISFKSGGRVDHSRR